MNSGHCVCHFLDNVSDEKERIANGPLINQHHFDCLFNLKSNINLFINLRIKNRCLDLFKFIQIDRFVSSGLNFVFADPFGPVEIVHEHEHSADSPERNGNTEYAAYKSEQFKKN